MSQKKHILIVDDEQDIIQSLQMILEDAEYKVTTFQSPKLALDAFSQSPNSYHLLITDMTMPEMNGSDLANQINRIRVDLPIIIFSGYSSEFYNEEQTSIPFSKFLTKPVSIEELLEAVEELI